MKPIILTDVSDDPLKDIQDRVVEVLSGNKISILNTANDSLVLRPSEIQGVLITTKDSGSTKPRKYSGSMEESNDKPTT